MTMITPSYLGETIEYSSLHACRSTLEDPSLRDEQREFNINRDKSFGRPDYQLKRELERRLLVLRGLSAGN